MGWEWGGDMVGAVSEKNPGCRVLLENAARHPPFGFNFQDLAQRYEPLSTNYHGGDFAPPDFSTDALGMKRPPFRKLGWAEKGLALRFGIFIHYSMS